MSDWAKRIQASIESMSRLVDNFQGGGTRRESSGASGSDEVRPASGASPLPAPVVGSTAASPPALPALGTSDKDAASSQAGRPGDGSSSSPMPPGTPAFHVAQLGFRRGLEHILAARSDAGSELAREGLSQGTSRQSSGGSRSGVLRKDGGESIRWEGDESQSEVDAARSSRAPCDTVRSNGTSSTDTVEALGERLLGTSDRSWVRARDRDHPGISPTASTRNSPGDPRGVEVRASASELSRVSTFTGLDPAGRVSELADDILDTSLSVGGARSGDDWGETKGEWPNLVTRPTSWDGLTYSSDSGSAVCRWGRVEGRKGHGKAPAMSLTSSSSFGPDLEAEIQSLEALAASLKWPSVPFDLEVPIAAFAFRGTRRCLRVASCSSVSRYGTVWQYMLYCSIQTCMVVFIMS